MQKAILIINPFCQQGKGWKKWLAIKEEVYSYLRLPCREVVCEPGSSLKETLHPLLQQNEKTILVSVGGDGSVHYLVNYLMNEQQHNVTQLTLGAVGLGSSNDFLKPFNKKIKNIPVRINWQAGTILHDIGVATYSDQKMDAQKKFFIVNASTGVTAQANWNFNHPRTFLRFIKKHATGSAIAYTAVSTILKHNNASCRISYNNSVWEGPVSNINVLKVPYVSGSFFYDQDISRDDGRLALNACMDMSKIELLSVLVKLQKGSFPVTAKTISAFTQQISLTAERPFVFECDGETEITTSLQLSLLPNALPVLKN